jgi:uncharacterized protein
MQRALNAAFIALCLICPGSAEEQGQPDTDTVAAATELVMTMRKTDGFVRSLPEILQVMRPIVTRARPEIERDFTVAAPVVLDATEARITELVIPMIAGVYARNFTVSEMRELVALYRTPAGQKFLDKSLILAQEAGKISQNMGNIIAREMHEQMIEELRKLGQQP